MGFVSIACYRPKQGKLAELIELVRDHVPILVGQGLATGRTPIVLQSEDGTVVEVFEWVTKKSIEDAHSNPVVGELWVRFNDACDYVSLNSLPESQQMFAGFQPINFGE